MIYRYIMPLLAATLAVSPAAATVTLVKAGAYSKTQQVINGSSSFKPGSDEETTSLADPYVVSKADQTDAYRLAQIATSAAAAVQINSLADIDLLARASVTADSLPDQVGTHGTSFSSAMFTFSIDTESTLSFAINTAPVSATPDSYVTADLFSLDANGLPQTYYRQGVAAGYIAPTYDLKAGTYTVLLSAYADGSTPAFSRFNGYAHPSTIAGATLLINSPAAAPVPEPETWAMMVTGFGFAGGALRLRRRSVVTA